MTDLRSRAAAACRLPALPDRWGPSLAARDPMLSWPAARRPSTYSLTPEEFRREATRLLAAGWAMWELAAVLAVPDVEQSA